MATVFNNNLPSSTSPASQHAAPQEPTKPHAPLRPFPDILSRLTWDPSIPSLHTPHPSNIYIGYIDRHVGILEKPLNAWQRDTTAEDFIPQHRVRYVVLRRRRGEGDEMDWEEQAKAKEDEEELRGVIGRIEERILATRSEQVRTELEAMVTGLSAKLKVGYEGGGETDEAEEKEHRQEIDEVVILWHREERIDRVFGSGIVGGGGE